MVIKIFSFFMGTVHIRSKYGKVSGSVVQRWINTNTRLTLNKSYRKPLIGL